MIIDYFHDFAHSGGYAGDDDTGTDTNSDISFSFESPPDLQNLLIALYANHDTNSVDTGFKQSDGNAQMQGGQDNGIGNQNDSSVFKEEEEEDRKAAQSNSVAHAPLQKSETDSKHGITQEGENAVQANVNVDVLKAEANSNNAATPPSDDQNALPIKDESESDELVGILSKLEI